MDAVNLGRQNYPAKKRSRHIPSVVQPDTLFHFVSKREYLMGMLKSKRIAPRYCCENFRYLNVRTVKELAFPMSCFCDIGLQKLEPHMNCYGSFGIALPKEWCMQKGFQAVQYLNHEGALASDTKTAIRTAMATLNRESSTKPEEVLTSNRIKGGRDFGLTGELTTSALQMSANGVIFLICLQPIFRRLLLINGKLIIIFLAIVRH